MIHEHIHKSCFCRFNVSSRAKLQSKGNSVAVATGTMATATILINDESLRMKFQKTKCRLHLNANLGHLLPEYTYNMSAKVQLKQQIHHEDNVTVHQLQLK
jgi:hypothetical protein